MSLLKTVERRWIRETTARMGGGRVGNRLERFDWLTFRLFDRHHYYYYVLISPPDARYDIIGAPTFSKAAINCY